MEELGYAENAWIRDETGRDHADLVDLVAPVLPESPPAPGRWTGPSPGFDAHTFRLCLGRFVASVALTLAFHSPIPMVVFASWMAQVGVTWLRYGGVRFWLPADLRLLEDPFDPDVCLVEMEVFVGRKSVGWDRGAAWFEGGRLLFSGRRTSFALGGEDVLPPKHWSTIDANLGAFLPDLAVPLRLPKGQAHVRLVPIRKGNDVADQQEERFLKRLYEFRLRPPRSHGPRQWPPLERGR